ncbi:MAG: 6-bladed beta-propeller [Acidobacteria bacterium]|nr:6-bladed beta-propeller [Acidobacteriota bacterium]
MFNLTSRFILLAALSALAAAFTQLKTGPPLPHKLVNEWAKLPAGWNFGEVSGVATDRQDNVWVFNRGAHPVMQFDRAGKFLQAWPDLKIVSSHGIRVDAEGNIWLIDVKGHVVFKCNPQGRVLMVLGNRQGTPGNNDSKDAFNEPTGIAFAKNGDFYISDGYINARVIKFNRDGEYLTHWGRKGTGDGEFNLVHDVCLDAQERVYVADRLNNRIQIFDAQGKFLGKWTDIGSPWGLVYSQAENCIFMCDGVNNRIVKLSLDGQVLGTLSSYGKVPGKLDFVHNIALDSTGALYVAEIKNWRVQKFAAR